jgi:hypothetical protein
VPNFFQTKIYYVFLKALGLILHLSVVVNSKKIIREVRH